MLPKENKASFEILLAQDAQFLLIQRNRNFRCLIEQNNATHSLPINRNCVPCTKYLLKLNILIHTYDRLTTHVSQRNVALYSCGPTVDQIFTICHKLMYQSNVTNRERLCYQEHFKPLACRQG